MFRSLSVCIVAITLGTLCVGCGGDDGKLEVHPTQAQLMLDGQPFGPTSLRMLPVGEGGRSVAGYADENGKVSFTSYDAGDGAPAGEYKVVVGMEMSKPPKPFPAVYIDRDKTPLKVTVEPDQENHLQIVMDSSVGGGMYNGPSFGRGRRGAPDMRAALESPEFKAGAEP